MTKASPGPAVATSPTGTPARSAANPSTEKTTKPAQILVPLFTSGIITDDLEHFHIRTLVVSENEYNLNDQIRVVLSLEDHLRREPAIMTKQCLDIRNDHVCFGCSFHFIHLASQSQSQIRSTDVDLFVKKKTCKGIFRI